MSNKKPKRFKKVVEYDWDYFNLEYKTESFWDILGIPFYAIFLIPLFMVTILLAPIRYFTERKVYYEEVKE